MIKVIIEIRELDEGSQKALNVALRVNRENETPIERGMEQRILPPLKELLKKPGMLGEPGD
jgi:hypothetical protein